LPRQRSKINIYLASVIIAHHRLRLGIEVVKISVSISYALKGHTFFSSPFKNVEYGDFETEGNKTQFVKAHTWSLKKL